MVEFSVVQFKIYMDEYKKGGIDLGKERVSSRIETIARLDDQLHLFTKRSFFT